MSNQEKRAIVSILSTAIVFAFYCFYVYQKYSSGILDPANDFSQLGKIILIFIAVQIGFNIIITIIFSIINAIVTGESDDPGFTDERDKLIGLKASQISYIIAGIGFASSLIALALGMIPFLLINIIFASFNLADIVGNFSQLWFYRRGV